MKPATHHYRVALLLLLILGTAACGTKIAEESAASDLDTQPEEEQTAETVVDLDGDSIVEGDECPDAKEIFQGFMDDDGCPDEPMPFGYPATVTFSFEQDTANLLQRSLHGNDVLRLVHLLHRSAGRAMEIHVFTTAGEDDVSESLAHERGEVIRELLTDELLPSLAVLEENGVEIDEIPFNIVVRDPTSVSQWERNCLGIRGRAAVLPKDRDVWMLETWTEGQKGLLIEELKERGCWTE